MPAMASKILLFIPLFISLLLNPSSSLPCNTYVKVRRATLLTPPRSASNPTAQLLAIAPGATSCTGAPFPSECVTASTALAPILKSFTTYSVTTAAEQAALLSWMAFESGDFKYNQNHFPAPGNPGQGTRCMMSPAFVKMYATSIPNLAVSTATSPAAILALVQGDEYSFGAASWFLTTQCSSQVRAALQTGSQAGWEGFITGCVGTTITSQRTDYWNRAKAALGV